MSSFDKNGRLKVHVDGVGSGITVVNNITTSNPLIVKSNGGTGQSVDTEDFSTSFIITSSLAGTVKISASFGTDIRPISTSSFQGTSSLFAREDHVHQDYNSTIGSILEIYQTTSQFVSNSPSFSTINFESNRVTNSIYTISSSRNAVTFLSAGLYQINYRVSVDNTSNQVGQALSALTLNGTPVVGSYAYQVSNRNGQGVVTLNGFVLLFVSTNDILRVVAQKQSGGGNLITVNSGTNILITRWT